MFQFYLNFIIAQTIYDKVQIGRNSLKSNKNVKNYVFLNTLSTFKCNFDGFYPILLWDLDSRLYKRSPIFILSQYR